MHFNIDAINILAECEEQILAEQLFYEHQPISTKTLKATMKIDVALKIIQDAINYLQHQ